MMDNKSKESFPKSPLSRARSARSREARIILHLVFVFFLGSVSMACSEEKVVIPSGDYVKASGNRVYALNFEKNRNELIYSFPVGTVISEKITQIDERTVLLSIPSGGRIIALDIIDRKISEIGVGLNPTFMSKHGKIVYYGLDEDGSGALLIADKEFKKRDRVAGAGQYNQSDGRMIIKKSADEILFHRNEEVLGSEKREKWLWKYNIATNELVKLRAIDDCRLLNAWVSKTNQVICQKITPNRFDTYFYLTGLHDEEEVVLDFDEYLNVGEYIEELNSLIIQKGRVEYFREIYDLWVLDLTTGNEQLLMEGSGFAIDSFMRLE